MLIFRKIFWSHCEDCGILVPRPGVEPTPSAVKEWNVNHWSAREFLKILCFVFFNCRFIPQHFGQFTGTSHDSQLGLSLYQAAERLPLHQFPRGFAVIKQ